MRRTRATAVLTAVTLVLAGASGFLAPTASAVNDSDQYGTLVAPDRTATGTACVTSVVEFKPSATITAWTLSVAVGTPSAGELPSFTLTPASPKKSITLCPGRNLAGNYGLDGYLSAYRVSDAGQVTATYDAYINFRVIERKPTALAVSTARSTSAANCPGFESRPKHCWKVVGKLTRAGKPYAWAYVQIQAYKGGRWVRQAWGRTNGLGKVTWFATVTRRESSLKWRLYFPRSDHAKASVSRTFTLKY